MHETEIHRNTIEKLKRGSYEAFDTLYDMYADSLYGFALLHTKSSVQAEDIVQETFLKLWNMRASLSVEGSFKSMLFTIAKNHVIDVFRQQINRPDFEDYIRFCEDEHLLDNTSVEKIYYDDFIDKLAIAKQKLTPAQRNIFEMSREEGMSNAEIAVLSDISEQTVKNHLSAALKILREELRKYNYLYNRQNEKYEFSKRKVQEETFEYSLNEVRTSLFHSVILYPFERSHIEFKQDIFTTFN